MVAPLVGRIRAKQERSPLRDRTDVVRALRGLYDRVETKSGSIVFVSRRTKRLNPQPPGFGVAALDERARLIRNLRRLSERDRLLLFLWYVEEWPVVRVADHLGLSRVHCYRLRDKALDLLVDPVEIRGSGSGRPTTDRSQADLSRRRQSSARTAHREGDGGLMEERPARA